MNHRFFENPILNSPYRYPSRHWELDGDGQPTRKIIESRRRAEFISPIPKPKKRGGKSPAGQESRHSQESLIFDEGKGSRPANSSTNSTPRSSTASAARSTSGAAGRTRSSGG